MTTLFQGISRHKFIVALLLTSLIGGWYVTRKEEKATYETTTVKNGNIVQEVSVTGRVESDSVTNLSFEKGGKISTVPLAVGTRVQKGGIIARLDMGELDTSRAQATANLEYELVKLAEIQRGARPEDISISESRVESATATLLDARVALEDKLNTAITTSDDIVFNKTDHLFENPRTTNPRLAFPVTDVNLVTHIESERFALTENLQIMSLPVSDLDASIVQDKKIFMELKMYFDNLSKAINALLPSSSYPQATIDSWKSDVSSARTNLNSAVTALLSAEQVYRSAASALAIAKKELTLKQAGPTSESVSAQEARIASMRASIANYDTQITKSVIIAPFSGVITLQNAKLGEIVSPNSPLVTLMSENNFKITANVPEVDVAKLAIGQNARVTLDAYGADVAFPASVALIDPAETVISGVSTYKVTLRFTENDKRIRSGMTANIDISTATRTGALYIPARSVISRDGKKFVKIPDGVTQTKETEVTVGLRGSDGSIEILSGLKDGETIVTFEQQ